MTQRITEIARALLAQLAEWDDPADEAVLHYSTDARVKPSALRNEFAAALAQCDAEGWITGVRNPLRGTRWAITDKGRALLQS